MRAVGVTRYGDPDVLSVVEVPEPQPGPGEVRIRVTAASVNPVDLQVRAGVAAKVVGDTPFPLVLGWDAAGVVDAMGDEVEGLDIGDRVMAMSLWFVTRAGTHAEAVVLPADAVAVLAGGVDDVAAATVPLNGLTAWSALTVANLEPEATVVVTGAAGGVGGYLVELGAARGLRVVGVGRPGDSDTFRALGGEAVTSVGDAGQAPVVIDTTGNPDSVVSAVAPGGRLLTLSGALTGDAPDGVTVKRVGVRVDSSALRELAAMAGDGRLTLRVADVLPLSDAAEAHRRLGAGGVRGRIVLRP
jgi:NADPH2:quinone reductase